MYSFNLVFDSGASNHITSNRSTFHNISEYGGTGEIILGDGKGLKISYVDIKHINTPIKTLYLPIVLCVPNLD